MAFSKNHLMAAVAAAALVVAGGAVAQDQQKQLPGAQTQGQGGAQMKTSPGGAQVQGQGSGQLKTSPGGAQVQGQGSGEMKTGQGGVQTQGGAKTQTGQKDDMKSGTQTGQKSGQPGTDQAKSGSDAEKPAQLSEQQRTKISSTISSRKGDLRRVERTEINFSINVGAVVPRTVNLAPLPAYIVEVVPAYRGYLYILVGAELIIVHPRTYEIVAVIPA